MRGNNRCDVVVVGAGMLGASAARHLADKGCDVILVGQAEPSDRQSHQGVFGSHYDVARVSRVIDPDPIRAWLGSRSVAQLTELADRTGITVVNPVGHLWVESAPGLEEVAASGERYDLGCIRRSREAAASVWPFLFLSGGSQDHSMETIWEPPPAGSVDPRAYVRAEILAAVAAGARHVQMLVDAVRETADGVEVVTRQGTVVADRALLATGAFTGHGTNPATGIDIKFTLHTQLLVHLDAQEVKRLDGLPSIIGKYANPVDDFYLTPPVPDPDASGERWILKIGSPQAEYVRAPVVELADWFRTAGDPESAANLARIIGRLLPDLRDVGRSTTSCVTTYTPSGHPYIDLVGDRTWCAVGGNGYAAKCAPALGELAAGLLLGLPWPADIDRDLFRVRLLG